jgi:uncharacterized protein
VQADPDARAAQRAQGATPAGRGAAHTTGYFRIAKAANGQLTFDLKSPEHDVLLSSKTYPSMLEVRQAIEHVRRNCAIESRYERRLQTGLSPYFILLDVDNGVLATSDVFATVAAMEAGIRAVMEHGVSSVVKPAL